MSNGAAHTDTAPGRKWAPNWRVPLLYLFDEQRCPNPTAAALCRQVVLMATPGGANPRLVTKNGRHRRHHLGRPDHELHLAAAATSNVTLGLDAEMSPKTSGAHALRRGLNPCEPQQAGAISSQSSTGRDSCLRCSCPGEGCDIRTYVATDVATSRLRLRVAARVWVVGSEQFCSAPHDVDAVGRESLA